MTQRHLAYHLRVSVQAVSKWERSKTYPDVMLLPVIADLFSVSLDELFGREIEKTEE
jgi:transcriptional regulator with XRE-family HTH domain